ncbi:MAG: putative dual-specificity RNA methyltransferase RlmN [Acidimicrobiales bacterium]|nr:MAG: 23S rRNA (adenine(2503)-C(2))-methyltransferase RlmN [Actinomycetota bacterium]MBV6509570.1 putative dual-specificity RNA methyltransferase RlmN [Acidimicrobiales bacterium]RIK06568.1 MAG: 23S rRNA (adenine(2503)-C(2))-methyltransferase RlmN [Acidobacteriota bacterium]
MLTRYDACRDDIASLLQGEPRYRVEQIWQGLYRRHLDPAEMTDLPLSVRETLSQNFPPALRQVSTRSSTNGDTIKWLWGLRDGVRIETVLMRYSSRTTVCVSTQAGCGMGCGFCATGQAGFERNLTIGEIVEQVVRAARASGAQRVSNVVFMGMGEPFANFSATWAGLLRINRDMGIAARKITLSTVGVVPGIRRLAALRSQVGLAVSLHAADDSLRDELVPLNRRYPLVMLADACREYCVRTGRRLSFEWAMIDGTNDSQSDAEKLAAYAAPLQAHVNLLPLNPTPGSSARGSPPERIRLFRDNLRSRGVNTTIRHSRGVDMDAACGQLRAGVSTATGRPRRT